jgi:MoaA/NifB/PqqE/SkfB family radical SAM enzyme/ubiquinone/menaquinone biosynthesis C-methylase UbiE
MTKIPVIPPGQWQRITFAGQPIYLDPERPDWHVPGPEADRLLQKPATDPATGLLRTMLINQLDGGGTSPYGGRSEHLRLDRLRECWFHLTSRCNLACGHCLFASSPGNQESLAPDLLQKGLREARDLGSNLFYFTGGEPFIYPDFPAIIGKLLEDPAVHVVILTNGLLLDEHLARLTALPRARLHLQISLDGLEGHHDFLRGAGTFKRLMAALDSLAAHRFAITLSVAVNRINVGDLAAITSLAARKKVTNLHFLWHFVRGKGTTAQFVAPAVILPELLKAQAVAVREGVAIDNIETIRSQVFSSPGTRFDLSNAGWESLAVGPDGQIYPSPALVGVAELAAGHLADGLEQAWRHSPVMARLRQASLIDAPATNRRPLRFLTGGGDIDHSYLVGGEFTGHDPYLDLYEAVALWLISERAGSYPLRNSTEIQLRMGDVRSDCPDGGKEISLTHCNCVISISGSNGRQSVREFYGQAARRTNNDITNPFGPTGLDLTFIPTDSQSRSYGCGSPVADADLQPGETVVDLGSGSGVECFLAAEKVGPAGRVFGIDMTEEMLALAQESQREVVGKLGYDNLEFRHGYLEDIPLEDGVAEVVISNCVINLSPDKRRTLHEIFRILKPGGRLVVADIVTDQQIPTRIRNNEKFRGECLGGALQQEQLLAMLRAAGFAGAELLKRFPYRREGGTQFYSLTFRCLKPEVGDEVSVIYRGPLEAVLAANGRLLFKGRKTKLSRAVAAQFDDALFIVDAQGQVVNRTSRNPCCDQAGTASGQLKMKRVEDGGN